MKRVMVVGCCGSGKSTFSKKLHEINGLELIHLDQHYWKPNWTESPKEEWIKRVKSLSEKPNWIIDGNYGGTMDIRLNRADTIFYLDYSSIRCLYRITKRTLKYYGQVRPDMVSGCKERFDLEFFHYVATFNLTRRKTILKKLNAYKKEKNVYVLKSDKVQDHFLKNYLRKLK